MKPRAVPRVEPVGDDVGGLADAFDAGDRRSSRARWAGPGTTGASSGTSPPTASSRTHASTPSSMAGQRLPAELATAFEPQPVPRADECAAVHGAGAQRGAEVRAGARPDVQLALGCRATRRPRSRRRRCRTAGRRGLVLAANTYQFPLGRGCGTRQGILDDRRLGVAVGRPLPLQCDRWKVLQRNGFRPPRAKPGVMLIAAVLLRGWPAAAGRGERPWIGTVCRVWPSRFPTAPAVDWRRRSRWWRHVPSARRADRCGCRHRPAPSRGCGVSTSGRRAWSPGANRGQSSRYSIVRRRSSRRRGLGVECVQAIEQWADVARHAGPIPRRRRRAVRRTEPSCARAQSAAWAS